jgi:hypothetical protein
MIDAQQLLVGWLADWLHLVPSSHTFFLRVKPIFSNPREMVRALICPSDNAAI